MLFFNPGLSRVRLELGVLYFRLGAFAQARSYLESAIAPSTTPPDVRARVQGFLEQIDQRDRPSQFSGFVQIGARYQSNANAGPTDLNIRALGFDAVLNSHFASRPDWNAFLLGGLRHVYDFGSQDGTTWETALQYYVSRQNHVRAFDINLVELTSGPRFALNIDDLPGWSVHPYFIVGDLGLGAVNYVATTGYGGVSINMPFKFAQLEVGVENRRRSFQNSNPWPLASQQSGDLTSVYGSLTVPITPMFRLQAHGVYVRNSAQMGFNSYDQLGADVGFVWEFEAPLADSAQRWSIATSIGKIWSDYNDPNPLVDPLMTRKDHEFRAGVALDAPLGGGIAVGAQFLAMQNRSSLPNYRFNDYSVMFGPSFRF
jgi:hypothetical protein